MSGAWSTLVRGESSFLESTGEAGIVDNVGAELLAVMKPGRAGAGELNEDLPLAKAGVSSIECLAVFGRTTLLGF